MVPGALEPRRQTTTSEAGAPGPRGPHTPVLADDPEQKERENEAGGVPAQPVTVLDRIQLMGLRLTEAFIRALASPPRFVRT